MVALSTSAYKISGNASLLVVSVMTNDSVATQSALLPLPGDTQNVLQRIIFLGIMGNIFQRLYIIYNLSRENYGQILTYRLSS